MLNSRIGFNGIDFPPDKLLVGHLVFLLLGLSLHHHFLVLLHLAQMATQVVDLLLVVAQHCGLLGLLAYQLALDLLHCLKLLSFRIAFCLIYRFYFSAEFIVLFAQHADSLCQLFGVLERDGVGRLFVLEQLLRIGQSLLQILLQKGGCFFLLLARSYLLPHFLQLIEQRFPLTRLPLPTKRQLPIFPIKFMNLLLHFFTPSRQKLFLFSQSAVFNIDARPLAFLLAIVYDYRQLLLEFSQLYGQISLLCTFAAIRAIQYPNGFSLPKHLQNKLVMALLILRVYIFVELQIALPVSFDLAQRSSSYELADKLGSYFLAQVKVVLQLSDTLFVAGFGVKQFLDCFVPFICHNQTTVLLIQKGCTWAIFLLQRYLRSVA